MTLKDARRIDLSMAIIECAIYARLQLILKLMVSEPSAAGLIEGSLSEALRAVQDARKVSEALIHSAEISQKYVQPIPEK